MQEIAEITKEEYFEKIVKANLRIQKIGEGQNQKRALKKILLWPQLSTLFKTKFYLKK